MAFKMKGNPYKLGKMATKSTMKMAKEAMKMKKESPMEMKTSYKMKEAMAKMKSPMELKKDSPMDKYKSDAQRKAVHASKAERGMTMKKEAPMKAAKPDYIDLDGDGNKTESMKQAAADKKSMAKMKPDMRKTKDIRTKDTRPNPEVRKPESTRNKRTLDRIGTAPADAKKRGTGLKPMTKEAMTKMKKAPLKQDKTKNKKRKLSVMDKIKAASAAVSTSKGPFGDTNFLDRYKKEKKAIRKGNFTGDSFKTG